MRLGLALVVVVACGAPPSTKSVVVRKSPSHIVLRVDNVVAAALQPTGKTWDGEAPQRDDGAGCGLFGKVIGLAVAGVAAPLVVEGANLLCRGVTRAPQQQRDATNPDLQVRVGTADGTPYTTQVIPDVTQALFGRRFVIPTEAVPPDGLIVEVVDDDLAAGAQQIGAVRLARDELLAALDERTHMMIRDQKPSLLKIEFVVSVYNEPSATIVDMPAREGTRPNVVDVVAGEVVTINAMGTYRVGSWYDANVTPIGYPGGGPRGYNFKYEPLASAAHACGFALLGDRDRTAALVNPSASFVAPTAGPLLVGINDNEPGNNTGSIRFDVRRRGATAAEWTSHRTN